MKSGAIDFLTKPFDRDQLVECMDRMLDSVTPPPANAASTPIFFGKSEALNETLRLLDLVVPLSTTVLLTGDTGTGKDLAARYLHQKGRRPDAPFVSLHCGAVPENLLEDELFGHVKGAFTGADRDRAGCFEMADDGTLFLDEIGTMSLSLQGKLLRVLQDQEVRRLGDSTTRRVTVRVIVATNSDLEKMVLRQQFRADLYYRVASFPIRLPTLAERGMDIVLHVRGCHHTGGSARRRRERRARRDELRRAIATRDRAPTDPHKTDVLASGRGARRARRERVGKRWCVPRRLGPKRLVPSRDWSSA